MDCNKIWADLQDAIKEVIDSIVSYNIHIKKSKAISFNNSVFTISVPSTISRNLIEFRFKDKIEGIIEAYTGQKVTLKIILESEIDNLNNESEKPVIDNKDREIKTDILLNEKFTFENFVIGSSNEYAAAAAISASENPGIIYNPLFIYGNSGLGKTHLMCAIGNKIKKEHPDYKVIYIPAEKTL